MPMYDVFFAVLEGDRLRGQSAQVDADSIEEAESEAEEQIRDRAAGRPYMFSVGEEGSIRSRLSSGPDAI